MESFINTYYFRVNIASQRRISGKVVGRFTLASGAFNNLEINLAVLFFENAFLEPLCFSCYSIYVNPTKNVKEYF